jgi:hypothetical protein
MTAAARAAKPAAMKLGGDFDRVRHCSAEEVTLLVLFLQ